MCDQIATDDGTLPTVMIARKIFAAEMIEECLKISR